MCEPCLRARTVLAKVPENVPWVRCARCGIVEIDGKWENTTESEVWDELLHRNLVVHERAEDIQLAMEPSPSPTVTRCFTSNSKGSSTTFCSKKNTPCGPGWPTVSV